MNSDDIKFAYITDNVESSTSAEIYHVVYDAFYSVGVDTREVFVLATRMDIAVDTVTSYLAKVESVHCVIRFVELLEGNVISASSLRVDT